MEAPLQQRIVGAIVLVTLGVIFIPALLDGSGYKARQAKNIVVQEKPRFPPQSKKKLDPVPTPLDKKRNVKVEQAKKQTAVNKAAASNESSKEQNKKKVEPDSKSSSTESKSKAMAKVKAVAKVEPKIINTTEKTKVDNSKVDKAKADKPADNREETNTSKKKRIKSFAIQVGTFDSRENAEKIRNELRKKGYTTYIQKSESKTNPSYRVRIGPELDYDVLEKRLKKLKKSRRYDGYIVNHP